MKRAFSPQFMLGFVPGTSPQAGMRRNVIATFRTDLALIGGQEGEDGTEPGTKLRKEDYLIFFFLLTQCHAALVCVSFLEIQARLECGCGLSFEHLKGLAIFLGTAWVHMRDFGR